MHLMADDPRRFLPLSPQQFHILLALTDGHRHGYGIIQDVAGRTEGAVRLGTGTLYTALVDESDRRAPPAEDDDRRRYYRLTPLGRAVLTAETERLETLVRHARKKGVAATNRPALSRTR
jgi:DNA-binding PadR family transcriptional regulator